MKSCNYVLLLIFESVLHFFQFIGHYLFSFYHRKTKNICVPPVDDPLLLIPACELAKNIVGRKLSSEKVVLAYIKRLRLVNPLINAICHDRYDEALEEAKSVDWRLENEEPPTGGWPVLFGVPVTIKESFALKGFQHTAGLRSRIGLRADKDAPAVHNLRQAGAIILATTNLSELCMWWESHNKVYGVTKNPYSISSIVGGSSGGEAALVAAGASVMGLASDIGGSVRMPAFFCGVFGHKPTTGTAESGGQHPECDSEGEWYMISSGPICRYSDDLKLFISVILKPGMNKELRLFENVNLSQMKYFSLEEWGAKFVSDCVETELIQCQVKIAKIWAKQLNVNVESVKFPEFFYQLAMWEGFISDKDDTESKKFTQLLAGESSKEVSPFKELFKWFMRQSDHTLPAIAVALAEKRGNGKRENHMRQVAYCQRLREKISDVLGENGVMFAQVHPKAGYFHHQTVLHLGNFSYTGIWNALGFPCTSVPMGLNSRGLPLGIQVISNLHNDRLCLAVANKLEDMFGGWVSPK